MCKIIKVMYMKYTLGHIIKRLGNNICMRKRKRIPHPNYFFSIFHNCNKIHTKYNLPS